MGIFKIEGGIRPKGEITPQGAKTKHLQNFMCCSFNF
jgi:hypothetical protein